MALKTINFFDGYTSGTAPEIKDVATASLVQYADDNAYELAETTTEGSIYFNTTTAAVKYFNGLAWITLASGTELFDHTNDSTIHFEQTEIDHVSLINIGNYSHAQVDAHIEDGTIHFTEASIDHTDITNIGTNTHSQIDTHIADVAKHLPAVIGSDGQVATVVTGEVAWTTFSALTNPMTTTGDIIRGAASGTPERLAIGALGTLLRSNGTTAAWDSSIHVSADGNVGIGTSSPGGKLDVSGTGNLGVLIHQTSTPAAGTYSQLLLAQGSTLFGVNDKSWQVGSAGLGSGHANFFIQYWNGSTYNEHMRIDSDGNFGIGASSPATKLEVVGDNIRFSPTNVVGAGYHHNASSVDSNWQEMKPLRVTIDGFETFVVKGNGRGFINVELGIGVSSPSYQLQLATDSAGKPNGGSWANSSDSRLKENIELADLDICYNIVKTLPLKRYRWKDNSYTDEQIKDRTVVGWIAQDVQTVFPKAVEVLSFTHVDGSVTEDCLSLNETMVQRTLYGAVQKLIAENDAKDAQIAALIARIEALEAR